MFQENDSIGKHKCICLGGFTMKSPILPTITRNKGFKNIDEILKLTPVTNFEELITTLRNNKKVTINNISTSNGNKQLVFNFKYQETVYFYKYDCPREPFKISPYNELVAGEIADDLLIPHVEYDLATISGFQGLISQDFRQENTRYISGKEFLINNHPLGKKENTTNLNNLEDIWLSLENHYDLDEKYRPIIFEVMQKIVNLFIFDIITGQVDRGGSNWYLKEYSNGKLDLQPLFDNIRILVLHHQLATERYPSVSKLLLTLHQDIDRFCEDNLEEFLKVSDNKIRQMFFNSLWVISPENLQKIFKRIEEKTDYPMPDELKEFYLNEFASQLRFLTASCNNIINSRSR